MNRLGDLQNFNLGMGLIVKPGQTITTKKSFFEGLGQVNPSTYSFTDLIFTLIIGVMLGYMACKLGPDAMKFVRSEKPKLGRS